MNEPIAYLIDRVAGMTADPDSGRVEVRFRREPMLLWVDAGRTEVIERIADAVEADLEINVAWRPPSQEIVSVVRV